MPAYNAARFLPQALASLQAQTLGEIEVVIVDDGSTDNTRQVLQPYLEDRRFRYYHIDNSGASIARNIGIQKARGQFVAFLDADDEWLPLKLQKQLPLFSDARVGVVYSKRQNISESGVELPTRHEQFYRGEVLGKIFNRNFVPLSAAVVRKRCFAEVGLFDPALRMAMDYDLFIRISVRYHFDYVDEALVKYRQRDGQLSVDKATRLQCTLQVREKNLKNPELSRRLPWWLPRYANSITFRNVAYLYFMNRDRRLSFKFYLKSIRCNPALLSSWRGLLKFVMPPCFISDHRRP